MSDHWCWKCQRERANERFSGAGHRRRLCRDCARDLQRERQTNRGAKLRPLTEGERAMVVAAVTRLRARGGPRTMSAVVAEIKAACGVDLPADGYAGFGKPLRFFGRAAREGLVVVWPQGKQEVAIWLPEEAAAEERRREAALVEGAPPLVPGDEAEADWSWSVDEGELVDGASGIDGDIGSPSARRGKQRR
jgi:hypothetical protein